MQNKKVEVETKCFVSRIVPLLIILKCLVFDLIWDKAKFQKNLKNPLQKWYAILNPALYSVIYFIELFCVGRGGVFVSSSRQHLTSFYMFVKPGGERGASHARLA